MHFWYVLLPDQKHFFYNRVSLDDSSMYVRSLETKSAAPDLRRVGNVGLVYGYASSSDPDTGWVLLRRGKTLLTQRFDARRLVLTGRPTVVVGLVVGSHANTSETAAFSEISVELKNE
jgi:hypothetical protein